MHKKRWSFWVLLLFNISLPLVATVSATYTPEVPIYFDIAPGLFTHNTVIGAKLGTFTITSTDSEIYTPAFVNTSEVGGTITLTGLYKNWEGGTYYTRTDLAFKIISVAYPYGYGGTPILQTIYGGRWPIVGWGPLTVTANPFFVEVYLVNTNDLNPDSPANLGTNGQFYRLDTPYTFTNTFNPIFSLAVAEDAETDLGTYAPASGNTIKENKGDYVETDGITGPEATPIVDPGSFTTPEGDGFYYGVGPVLPSFNFSFISPEVTFDLADAYGTDKVILDQAQIEVINGVEGDEYEQVLTFTDQSSAAEFEFFPVEGSTTPIAYQLYLGTDPVQKGTPIEWENLLPGVNSKDIAVGGINALLVADIVSGTYEGTITVTISNPN